MKTPAKASRIASEFKYKHFEGEVILWSVRWYSQFALSYRDLVIRATERGLSVAHTTLMRYYRSDKPKSAFECAVIGVRINRIRRL